MEKNDEIAGSGNSYTATFWQYDARLGRRWNIDPVDKPHEGSYVSFRNNPVRVVDPQGDDGYVNEDGDYLGDDGDEESHDTRVIPQEKWDWIMADAKNGKITDEMREKLQTDVKYDSEYDTEYGGFSKPLEKYEQGINISEDTWSKLEEKGGERLDPYVVNNSDETVWYRPEGNIDDPETESDDKDLNANPYTRWDKVYAVNPGESLYSRVDAVATGKYSDHVYKIPTNFSLKVTKDGGISVLDLNFLARVTERFGWRGQSFLNERRNKGDVSWDPIFEKAKQIGKRKYYPEIDWNEINYDFTRKL